MVNNVSDAATTWPVWSLIREARSRAGLSQVELALRAGTSQPAIARYERARAMPDLSTLHRLIEACGLELELRLVVPDAQRMANERAALDRSVEQRLDAVEQYTDLVSRLRDG
jgi:transcriptional regulator with XRE-family HTH domain